MYCSVSSSADHVGVFGVEVEQALIVRRRRAVADRLAHHHRAEAVLHRVDRGGAHAARGRAAGDDQRVDALVHQAGDQVGAEEARGVFLHQQAVARAHVEAGIDLDRGRAGLERQRALHLDRPEAGILEVAIVVDHGRIDHRNVALVRDRDQRLLRLDLLVEVGAERHGGVGEALEHVDHDQRRPLAEADLDAEAARPEEVLVVLAAGHVTLRRCLVPRKAAARVPRIVPLAPHPFCQIRPARVRPPISLK